MSKLTREICRMCGEKVVALEEHQGKQFLSCLNCNHAVRLDGQMMDCPVCHAPAEQIDKLSRKQDDLATHLCTNCYSRLALNENDGSWAIIRRTRADKDEKPSSSGNYSESDFVRETPQSQHNSGGVENERYNREHIGPDATGRPVPGAIKSGLSMPLFEIVSEKNDPPMIQRLEQMRAYIDARGSLHFPFNLDFQERLLLEAELNESPGIKKILMDQVARGTVNL
ncbi:MAG: hypothetical protein ACYDBV_04935 [Nitrospiria bacterium]